MYPKHAYGRTYTEEDASDNQDLEDSTSEPMDLLTIVSVCISYDYGALMDLLQIVLSGGHFKDGPDSQQEIMVMLR
jgi:hypothetical protein